MKLINFFKKVWPHRAFFLLKIHVLFKIFIYILRHKNKTRMFKTSEGESYVLQEEGNSDAEGSALCAERFEHYHKRRLPGCVLEHYQVHPGHGRTKDAASAASRTASWSAKCRHRCKLTTKREP